MAASNNNTAADQFNWTYDNTVPTISSVSLASTNSTIAVTMSEAVYTTTDASTALVVGDFAFSISGGTATLTEENKTPSSISISGNVYTLGISLSGTPDGSETLTVNPASATAIYDAGNNGAAASQSNNTATLNDQTAPTGLAATSYYGGAKLSWTANSESDLAEYYIYYSTDNSTYTEFSDEPTTNSYTTSGGTIGTLYYYKVSAVDISGNESSKSDAVSIKARGAWWVDMHNGDDSNDGKSESTAFETIHHAIDNSSLEDGDSIKVKPSITSSNTTGYYDFGTMILAPAGHLSSSAPMGPPPPSLMLRARTATSILTAVRTPRCRSSGLHCRTARLTMVGFSLYVNKHTGGLQGLYLQR
jgi:hypothetical protein